MDADEFRMLWLGEDRHEFHGFTDDHKQVVLEQEAANLKAGWAEHERYYGFGGKAVVLTEADMPCPHCIRQPGDAIDHYEIGEAYIMRCPNCDGTGIQS